ncbi:hypothetical protein [Burkholderia cenocepacia]|uniref:hypothetical protein n=1 Tax=Burkholderia cenocepacia TaxID=95486 RepID=UPI001D1236D8|nr:hypothetical protein [Burkholderia cenocepacia]
MREAAARDPQRGGVDDLRLEDDHVLDVLVEALQQDEIAHRIARVDDRRVRAQRLAFERVVAQFVVLDDPPRARSHGRARLPAIDVAHVGDGGRHRVSSGEP